MNNDIHTAQKQKIIVYAHKLLKYISRQRNIEYCIFVIHPIELTNLKNKFRFFFVDHLTVQSLGLNVRPNDNSF